MSYPYPHIMYRCAQNTRAHYLFICSIPGKYTMALWNRMGQNQLRTTCPVKLLGFWVFPAGFRQKWGQYIQVYDEFQGASLTTPTLKDTLSLGFELAGVGNGMFKISIMMWINTPLFLLKFGSRKMLLYGDEMKQRKGHSWWLTGALELSNLHAISNM